MADVGTDLFHRTMAFDCGDAERQELMRKVWCGTPWMIDAFTGGVVNQRCREMIEWCREQFGQEAWPLHNRPGRWQRGGATVHGWTWFGFSTEAELAQFVARWPKPEAETN